MTSPRLRNDLIVSRQQTDDGVLCIVKDPKSGDFFRFRETEQFIVEQLDGKTPLDVVRERTEARFAAALSEQHLNAFIARLDRASLLDTDGGAPRRTRARRRRQVRGSLLYLRWAFCNPDQLLERLVARVPFLFTRRFVALSGALIVLAAVTTLANWGDFTRDVVRLYTLSSIPLVLVVLFTVASAHEVAHGLTCKHFGGHVPEMGFMLIYFQPAMYTNVSDAWLFPERRQRLWVGLAGPWFELVIWALAALAWRLTDVEAGVHSLALMVMAVSGAKTLLNFNPLIKFDGYYLLSDYLQLPNLRKRSFEYVGGLIKRASGFGRGVVAELSARERRVYLLYGLVATVCSMGLLAYVVVTAGGFLVEQRQPAVLAMLAGVVAMKSRVRFRKLFGKARAPAVAGNGGSAVAGAEAAPKAPKKKRATIAKPWWVWGSLAVAALALLLFGRMQLRIGGALTVLPEQNADVRAPVEGIIEEILVTEGDSVQAGQVIARLSNHALVAELQKTGPAIRETRAFLSKLEAGPTGEELAVANAAVASAEDRLRFAQAHAGRIASLFETAAVTRQELDAAQAQATTAENELAEARHRVDLLLHRSRPEDIEAARARLALLETQRRFLDGEVRELTVLSPVSGVVATPARQLREMEHQLVSRGALIAKVYQLNTVTAQIVVSEKDIGTINVGQPVTLRVRAYPNTAFHGTVTAIGTAADGISTAPAPISSQTGGSATPGKAFIVTSRIDNRDLFLKPGMTGWAKVSSGSMRIGGLLTRRLARTFRVEVWSWW